MSQVPRASASGLSVSVGAWLGSADVSRWRSRCVAVLVLAVHAPLAMVYSRRLVGLEHYEFAPLLVLAVVVLLIRRGRSLRGVIEGTSRTPVLPSVVGLSLLAAAVWQNSPWLAAVSLIATSGLYLKHFSGRYARELLYAWAPLLLLVRVPFALDVVFMQRLQLETSLLASGVLDVLGIPHLRNGNILQVPGRQFLVEEACSGIHSVFALLATAAVYVAWARVPALRAALLLICAVIWACLTNLMRIIAIVMVDRYWGVDLTEGLVHDVLGGALFLTAAGLLVLSDRFLQFWLDPIEDDFPGAAEEIEAHPLTRRWNAVVRAPARIEAAHGSTSETSPPVRESPVVGWLLSILLCIVAIAIVNWEIDALPHDFAEDDWTRRPPLEAVPWIESVGEVSLPGAVGDWRRTGYGVKPLWGDHKRPGESKMWTYDTPHGPAVVSLDAPFAGWHDVTNCYLGTGAAVESYDAPSHHRDGSGTSFTEVVLRYPSGSRALLVFINFDEAGRDLENRSAWLRSDEPLRWLVGVVAARFAGNRPLAKTPQQITQFQLLIEFDQIDPSSALRNDAREKFHEFCRQIKHHLASFHAE